jgi:hypothetical protein
MDKLISSFLHSRRARLLICLGVLSLTGFARAPFPRWVIGKVTRIDLPQTTLALRESGSSNCISARWDNNTRLWTEPLARKDPGVAFDGKYLSMGDPIRILLKEYSDHNLATRIIRQATSRNTP